MYDLISIVEEWIETHNPLECSNCHNWGEIQGFTYDRYSIVAEAFCPKCQEAFSEMFTEEDANRIKEKGDDTRSGA